MKQKQELNMTDSELWSLTQSTLSFLYFSMSPLFHGCLNLCIFLFFYSFILPLVVLKLFKPVSVVVIQYSLVSIHLSIHSHLFHLSGIGWRQILQCTQVCLSQATFSSSSWGTPARWNVYFSHWVLCLSLGFYHVDGPRQSKRSHVYTMFLTQTHRDNKSGKPEKEGSKEAFLWNAWTTSTGSF